jgi:hypothetical protein
VGRLKDLEKEGWAIAPADKNAISAQIAMSQAAAAIAVSLENIKQSINSVQFPGRDESEIAILLDNHYALVRDLLSQIVPAKVLTWEFDIQRNKNGFLSKVIANGK